MSEKTVAPVVVKPDIASKTARTGESRTPLRRYGRLPNTAVADHAIVTIANPSRVVTSSSNRVAM